MRAEYKGWSKDSFELLHNSTGTDKEFQNLLSFKMPSLAAEFKGIFLLHKVLWN